MLKTRVKPERLGYENSQNSPDYIFGLGIFVIFVAALALRVWFNFYSPHSNAYAACDATEYINTARGLLGLVKQPYTLWAEMWAALNGIADSTTLEHLKQVFQPLRALSISGPIFPFCIALSVVFTGGNWSLDSSVWKNLLIVQSAVSALTCILIALIASRAFDKKTGIIAGLLAALYPGFIIASGRLYSESFACFLVCIMSFLVCRGFGERGNSISEIFLAGLNAACLQLTRSVMIVWSILLAPIFFFQNLQRANFLGAAFAILIFAMGFAAVELPWLGLQQLATGKSSLVVDRAGNYNLFIGNNSSTMGFLSFPYPDGKEIEKKSMSEIIKDSYLANPRLYWKLVADKPVRLLKQSWNDFKATLGPVTVFEQNLFHQAIVLFGLLGLCLCTFTQIGQRTLSAEQFFSRVFLAAMFAFHAVYLLFITVPRYNMTAMPELIVFAAAGITALFSLGLEKESRLVAPALLLALIALFVSCQVPLQPLLSLIPSIDSAQVSLVAESTLRGALLLLTTGLVLLSFSAARGFTLLASTTTCILFALLLPLFCTPLRANGRPNEWAAKLEPGRELRPLELEQKVFIPLAQYQSNKESDLYLILDMEARRGLNGLRISLNNEPLEEPLIPGLSLLDQSDRFTALDKQTVQREGEMVFTALSSAAGIANTDLRQWFLVKIPQSLVAKAAAASEHAHLDSIELVLKLSNQAVSEPITIFGAYHSKSSEKILPELTRCSWEKAYYGVENNAGLSDSRYDIRLKVSPRSASEADLSTEALGRQSGSFNVHALLVPPTDKQIEESSGAMGTGQVVSFLPTATFGSSSEGSTLSAQTEEGVEIEGPKQPENTPVSFPSIRLICPGKPSETASVENLPKFVANEFILLNLKGKVRSSSERLNPTVLFRAVFTSSEKGEQTYLIPWSPGTICSTDHWQSFNIAVALKPSGLPGRLNRIDLVFVAENPAKALMNVQHEANGDVEFRDLSFLPVRGLRNPLAPGHSIY